ncbi:MAG: ECF transporter S component [Clostridiales bacterium]|nr:ECF transporter S component [Clostridiales bacterium]
MKVKKLVLAALFAALAYCATLIIHIPSPIGGYLNLGDCIVLLAGWLLGPAYGAAAAGLGSALADLTLGYTSYIPGTFVIKALMAVVAYYAAKAVPGKTVVKSVISGVLAEVVMVGGYFCFEATILGNGLGAAVGIASNLMQALAGIVCAVLIKLILDKKNLWKW